MPFVWDGIVHQIWFIYYYILFDKVSSFSPKYIKQQYCLWSCEISTKLHHLSIHFSKAPRFAKPEELRISNSKLAHSALIYFEVKQMKFIYIYKLNEPARGCAVFTISQWELVLKCSIYSLLVYWVLWCKMAKRRVQCWFAVLSGLCLVHHTQHKTCVQIYGTVNMSMMWTRA